MPDNQNAAGGQNPDSGGTGDQAEPKKDQVSYDTHRKLLDEKKKRDQELRDAQAKLQQFEDAEKKRQEDELKAKGELQKLIDLRDEELKKAKGELDQVRQDRLNAKKLNAFLNAVTGDIPQKYLSLVPFDDVIVKDDGSVDEMSVTKLVESFQKEFPEVIRRKDGPKAPNDAPSGTGSIDYEAWKKLPAKEMRAKLKEVAAKG